MTSSAVETVDAGRPSDAPTKSKSLGLAACTPIVFGNMVGSGFYLSPGCRGSFGNLVIFAWIVMDAGAIFGLPFA